MSRTYRVDVNAKTKMTLTQSKQSDRQNVTRDIFASIKSLINSPMSL